MFDSIAPRYDLVNRIMTFRLDVKWRRQAIRAMHLPGGSTVLDLATGTGDFCRELEERGFHAVGADLSFGMLAAARTTAPLVHCDGLALPINAASVDGVTCGFALRNFVELPGTFAELARIVRDGGRIALLDASTPDGRVAAFGQDRSTRRIPKCTSSIHPGLKWWRPQRSPTPAAWLRHSPSAPTR